MKTRQKGLAYYMPLAEEIPYKFKIWAESLFDDQRYIFYEKVSEKKNSGYLGYCTSCNHLVHFKKARSGNKEKCPDCRKEMILRNQKFSNRIGSQSKVVCYVQYLGNEEYMLRYFKAHFTFEFAYKNSKREFSMYEHQRDVIQSNGREIKKFHKTNTYNYINKEWEEKWINGYYPNMYGGDMSLWDTIHTYSENLKNLTGKLKYSCSNEFFKENNCCNFADYIRIYLDYPQIIETLIKIKLFKAVREIMWAKNTWRSYEKLFFNFDKKDIYGFFNIKSKTDFKYILKNKLSNKQIHVVAEFSKRNMRYSKPLIDFCVTTELLSETKNAVILDVFTIDGFKKYAIQQNYATKDTLEKKLKNFTLDYADYINACIKLGFNIEDTMYSKPNNFKEMHDKILAELDCLNNQELYEEYGNEIKKYSKYNFTNKEFSIIVPQYAHEIKKEGKSQNHCVGGYIDRVISGNSLIVFVRKNSEINAAFYTMEINPKNNKIVQCRGYKNCETTPEVDALLEEYKRNILNKEKEKTSIKAAV